MTKNFIIIVFAIALVATSHMLYKSILLHSAIQKTSAVLTQIELSMDVFDCNMKQADEIYTALEDIHGDKNE